MDVRLRQALARAEEVAHQLADPGLSKDPDRLKSLGREHARFIPIVRAAERLSRADRELVEAREAANSDDAELVAMAKEDLNRLPGEIAALHAELRSLLLP